MLRFTRMALLLGLVAATALVAGCATDKAASSLPPVEVTDDALSYRHEPLDVEAGAPPSSFDAPDPGDSDLVPRAYENAPPVIPHNVDGLLPITADDNQCADCHAPENATDVGATPVPASHLYDMRNDRRLTDLNPANFNCTQCHVPQAVGEDLVGNSFEAYFRAQERRSSSNLLEVLNEGVE